MKKILALLLAALLVFALAGCGASESGAKSKFTSALEVLNKVYETYKDDEKFPIGGGDTANMIMDAPGKFDITKTDELDSMLGLTADQSKNIDDAASMVHMMNASSFTGAAYHLVNGTDADTFATAVKDGILSRQWICGMPDTLLIINVDGEYVIAAFGAEDLISTFKTNVLAALEGSKVIIETPVVENF